MSQNFGSLDPKERIVLHGEEEGTGRRSMLASGLVILVMVVFAGGLWLAYRMAGGHGEGRVPLIRAEQTPFKVRPSSPGGMKIPDRNMLIYGEKEPKVERLLPAPEQPMPRPGAEPSPAPPPLQETPPSLPAAAAARAVPSASAARKEPARPSAEHAAGSAARIQLGALKSEAAAREEWRRLRRAEPEILGRLAVETVRTDLGARGIFYRIEAGPFANLAEASRVCGKLRRHKIACLLVR